MMTNRINNFCLKTNPRIDDHFTERPIKNYFKSSSRRAPFKLFLVIRLSLKFHVSLVRVVTFEKP